MRYARLFASEDGESHFDEVDVEFTATDYVRGAPQLELSTSMPAAQWGFMRAAAGWTSDFHVAAGRNAFFVLGGEWEVTASDGESRRFAVGSVLLVEDTTGKGHASSVVSDTAALAAMIQLYNDMPPE